MEEIEVPTEHLHEAIHEQTKEHAGEKGSGWNMYVAISTAMVAVLAALAGLMAGHHSNEALIDQIRSSDQWAFYQAKGIKAEIKKMAVNDPTAIAEVERYKKEQEGIKEKAESYEKSSESHLNSHKTIAKSVTLFQIAIAISAIAILTRKKILWYVGLLFSAVAMFFFISGLL